MGKKRIFFSLVLALAVLVLLPNVIGVKQEKLVIKFHSEGNNKEMSISLLRFFPAANEFFYRKAYNVSIKISEGIATITPGYNWRGDEVLVFSPNKTLIENLERSGVEQEVTANLEPIIELSFPAKPQFVVTAGRIDFNIIAYDPDDNPLIVEWIVNGVTVKRDSSVGGVVSHFTFNPENSEEGQIMREYKFDDKATFYRVIALVNDSRSFRTTEWSFNIINQTCNDVWSCGNWSDCIDGTRTRVCTKKNRECPETINKPPTIWLDPSCAPITRSCLPNWTCDEWSECKTDYKADIVLKGVIAETIGTRQERRCYDSSYCIGSVGVETRDCDKTIPVTTKEIDWCHSKYIEVYNAENGMLISRVRKSMLGEGGMDIDLSLRELSRISYCWYCFDGVKDFDEDALDCGGASCPPCEREKEGGFSIADNLRFVLFIIADVLLLFYLWRRARYRA